MYFMSTWSKMLKILALKMCFLVFHSLYFLNLSLVVKANKGIIYHCQYSLDMSHFQPCCTWVKENLNKFSAHDNLPSLEDSF